jgi:hypothetical protein
MLPTRTNQVVDYTKTFAADATKEAEAQVTPSPHYGGEGMLSAEKPASRTKKDAGESPPMLLSSSNKTRGRGAVRLGFNDCDRG